VNDLCGRIEQEELMEESEKREMLIERIAFLKKMRAKNKEEYANWGREISKCEQEIARLAKEKSE